MKFEEYAQFDAVALAELVRNQEVTPDALINAAAQGVQAWNPQLNAIIDLWIDDARARRIDFNPDGALAGVPFLLKDMVEWEGRRMTLGSRLLDGYIAQSTHPLVARYLHSGLIPLGMTNMSELGLLPVSEPDFYGPTKNPWNLAHTPGGSSGGAAAAVAAGIVPAAHAADGGGSIRIPASCTGIFGLKPTRGQVIEAVDEVPEGFVSHHVVSRSVRDSALLLELSSGKNPASRWRHPTLGDPKPRGYKSFAQAAEQDPKELKIAVLTTDFLGDPLHPACRRAVEISAALLEELGHKTVDVQPPFDGLAFRRAFSRLWAVSAGFFIKRVRAELDTLDNIPQLLARGLQLPGALDAVLRVAQLAGQPLVEPLTLRLAQLSESYSPADLWIFWQELNLATLGMAQLFEEYDLLLTSTLAQPPWEIGHFDPTGTIEELERDLLGFAGLTPIANSAGLPAMSVPLYRDGDLPIGTQFIGPHAADALLLSLAGQLERARPWQQVAPLNNK